MTRITVQPNTFVKQTKAGWQAFDNKKKSLGIFSTERMARETCIAFAMKTFTFPKEAYEQWQTKLRQAEQIAGV